MCVLPRAVSKQTTKHLPPAFLQVFARIVERQATNVVRGGFGMLNVGQAFPALADVLDAVSPPPNQR